MKKTILILLITLTVSLFADALGHKEGEIYFCAYSKDAQGKYTVRTLYRTEDYGATAQALIKDFDYVIYADAQPGCFYRRTWGETLYFSSDTCRTWTYLAQDASNIYTTRHPGVLYIGIRYSTDYGQTWQISQHNGLPVDSCMGTIGYEKGEEWAYNIFNYKIYRSTDYGNNFTYVSTVVPNLEAGGIFAGWQPGEVFLAKYGVVYRSTDYGHTFSYCYTLTQEYAEGYLQGKSTGEFWAKKIRRYPQYQITNQKVTFYHITDFYNQIDSVVCNVNETDIEDNEELVIRNEDLTNYPNPFNNTTAISYQLPKAAEVELSAYNNKGELVRKLIAGQQNSGAHTVTFDAIGLNSGVYYIRLKYDNTTKTHKVLLVK